MYDHSRRTLTIASLAVLATFLDTTILYVAFPDITATFSNTSASELSWVLNAYTIVFAAMLIPAGKLADRIGHRKVFLTGSILFTVASMACGLAPSAELLIVFRIVQAVGAAALIPSSLALVMHAFAHDQLPRAVAIWGAAGAVAGALGPTLGAAIVEGLGWRWAFFINLPVGIYTVIAGRKNLHESSDPDTRVPSLVGVVLIAAAAGLLSYSLVGTDDYGWLSVRTLGVLVAGLLVLAVFVVHQRHTKAPALDLDLFRIANFRWANLAMLLFGTAFAALFFGSILFLTDVWDWSVLQAGFGVAPGPVVVGLVAPRAGKLAGRIGQRPLLIAGGILFASCGVLRLVTLGPDINYARDFLPSMLLSGLGVALVFPQLSSVVAQALPPGRAGVGGAVAQAVRQFGGTFGVALTVAFLGAAGAVIDGFDPIWWLIVVGGLGTSTLVLPMRTSTAPAHGTGQPAPSPPSPQENQHEHRRIRRSRHRRQPRPRRRILPHTPRPRREQRCTPAHATSTASTTPASSPCNSTSPPRPTSPRRPNAAATSHCSSTTPASAPAPQPSPTTPSTPHAASSRPTSTDHSPSATPSHPRSPRTAAAPSSTCSPSSHGSACPRPPSTAHPKQPDGRSPTRSAKNSPAQHTQVLGLYVGYMDTDMTAGITAPKPDPVAVANLTLDGIETGAHEVLADDISRHVRSALSGDLLGLYPQLAG